MYIPNSKLFVCWAWIWRRLRKLLRYHLASNIIDYEEKLNSITFYWNGKSNWKWRRLSASPILVYKSIVSMPRFHLTVSLSSQTTDLLPTCKQTTLNLSSFPKTTICHVSFTNTARPIGSAYSRPSAATSSYRSDVSAAPRPVGRHALFVIHYTERSIWLT